MQRCSWLFRQTLKLYAEAQFAWEISAGLDFYHQNSAPDFVISADPGDTQKDPLFSISNKNLSALQHSFYIFLLTRSRAPEVYGST